MFGLAALVVFLIVAIRDWSVTNPAHQIGLLAVAFALLVLEFLFPYGRLTKRGIVREK